MIKVIPEHKVIVCDICKDTLSDGDAKQELTVTLGGSCSDLSGPMYQSGTKDLCNHCYEDIRFAIEKMID